MRLNKFLNKFLKQPKNIFLVDGVGAAGSATMLLVLSLLDVGMPVEVLYALAGIAAVFAVYSLSCYKLAGSRLRTCLKLIMAANVLYCLLTAGLAFYFRSRLTVLGFLYFGGEVKVMLALVVMEWRVLCGIAKRVAIQ